MELNSLEEAKELLLNDKLISYPTETIFGLAVNPFSEKAVKKLFEFKQRPVGQGVTLIVDKQERLDSIGIIETLELKRNRIELQQKYWPGPLTVVVKVDKNIFPLSHDLLGPDNTIGLRVSSLELARDLASCCGGFVTATSANLRNETPAKTFDEARSVLSNIATLRGECLLKDSPSTIVDLSISPFTILREGAIALR